MKKNRTLLVSLSRVIDALPNTELLDIILSVISERMDIIFSLMGKIDTATDAFTVWTVNNI